jgi:hypothetical protein
MIRAVKSERENWEKRVVVAHRSRESIGFFFFVWGVRDKSMRFSKWGAADTMRCKHLLNKHLSIMWRAR